jgi:lipopolysaccharide/colanic/teichoic acid biosynthesis glycosyltransferase
MAVHFPDVDFQVSPVERNFYEKHGKRVFDLAASAIGLLLLSPLLLILALLVKLTSRGPVLYRQERVGRAGRIFRITKLRSMFEDADNRGPLITSANDSRVTPVGRMLRRLKFDELPQLWNVVKGDMSLVGPRPEVPRYVEFYSAAQRRVLAVRPGITDPASLVYRNEENVLAAQSDPDAYYRNVVLADKLNMNLEYLGNISFSYDLFLVLLTTGIVYIPKWITKAQ